MALVTIQGSEKEVKRLLNYLVQRVDVDGAKVRLCTERFSGRTVAELNVRGIYKQIRHSLHILDDDAR